MSENTPANIIKEIKGTPLWLNKISEDFFSIESTFNTIIKKLKEEKISINNEVRNTLYLIKKKNQEKINEIQHDWNNGTYIPKVLKETNEKINTQKKLFIVFKYIAILIGILVIFSAKHGAIIQTVFTGLLIIVIGFVIFNELTKGAKRKMQKISHYINKQTFNQTEKNVIASISGTLKNSLIQESNQIELNIKTLQNSLDSEYKRIETKEMLGLSNRIKEYEMFEERTLISTRQKVLKDVLNIQESLKNHVELLNQIPESYDPNLLNWDNPTIFKGKDVVSSYIRIGLETLNISIEGIQYSIEVPKCIPFLNKSNFVFNCNNPYETQKAIQVSHNIIARTILALPPNKIKITFIDPLELGGNAAPFSPLLREIHGGMVYTQTVDIEGQLTILTRSIENIILKYLQNNFKDIGEYNYETKEVPEAYRLLVIYNFPHGFNDTTIRKLFNIIKSGPKSGVHAIIINDKNAKLPYGFTWNIFEEANVNEILLNIDESPQSRFDFDKNILYNDIVKYINNILPNTNSIKVPFTKYIAPQDEWWKEKTHKQYSISIGRHALEEQKLKFDNGDDNQALLIGKPGSGKSNLLHVIIANSIWKYSPDQLEIYLIDFKEGIEFNIYADKKIPHIRTIAIESDREFGLSVLDGVEKELQRRGSEFSRKGVQNIEQYHESHPEDKMPRLLLIVDEFQEFYAEDDSIKQAVDDKLDRIIRKGRAYGINTLFASQTLSGNSIKKSTKELIDIRIALMCSDLDAHQILDDRNPAARDLTMSGEGVYNAENGKTEGNRKFQAFFIEKDALNRHIESVISFAKKNKHQPTKQIIFRGSEKAFIEKEDHPLTTIDRETSPKSIKLWIGEPVTIDDDVKATIRKQGGSNLLIAGHDENIGLRIMCSAIISIAAQHLPKTCRFYYFNFYNIDSEAVEIPEQLYNCIKNNQETINVSKSIIKETLIMIKEEIIKRQSGDSLDTAHIYVNIFSLQRGRIFRKEMSKISDEAQLIAYIIKEGPDMGIYTLVQIDTIENFTRNIFEDKILVDFSQRIASQMNTDNSVRILGNNKASKLGKNRAYYFDDNENTLIKFKPYELPNFTWVEHIQKPQSSIT